MTSSAPARIGELLDEAIAAVNNGDIATAHDLAHRILREDASNAEAEELIALDGAPEGEMRRLTILCCDLVGSTEMSERHSPERYRAVVRRYQNIAREIIEQRYGGHIVSVKGDGYLALFGYPVAHEDDTRRAVQAGLDLCAEVEKLSRQAQRQLGETLNVRVGVHRGLVYIDTDIDDVYGLAANLASRVEGLAVPGTVVVTDSVRRRVTGHFQFEMGTEHRVKGVSEPVLPFTVIGHRSDVRRATTPLVGRQHELDTLRRAWARACSGTAPAPTSVCIHGEAGLGKSRLAAALSDVARDDGATVVELSGSQYHSSAGFYPLKVLLESRCAIGRESDATSRLHRLQLELATIGCDAPIMVPLLAPIMALAPSTGYEPFAAEGRKLNDAITDAAYEYLVRCTGDGPALLLVEDAQWLDDSTSALLARVLEEGPGTLLVVLTSRDAAPFAVDTTLDLEPLTAPERLALVDSLAPAELSAEARAALAERSDGVPLYVEELVHGWEHMSDGGDGNGAVPAGTSLPDALYEPLAARLLSTTAGLTVAGAAATVGRDVDRTVLEALLEMPPDELDRELDMLIEASILVPTERDGELRFRHALLRGVAYELQSPGRRRSVHARAGDLLVLAAESHELVDWNMAATHYEQADRPADAANAYGHAADGARRRGALTEARVHLGRAIELVATLPPNRERVTREVGMRLRRGFLAMSTEGAGSAEAASDYARCLELAMTDARGDEMFSSLISLWAYHVSRGELLRARHVSETLRRSLVDALTEYRPTNHAGFGMVDWWEGNFAGAHQMLATAVSHLEIAGVEFDVDDVWFVPNDPTASIHTHLAIAQFMSGDTTAADASMERSNAITDALDFPQGPWSRAYGAWLHSWMLAERGDFDRAEAMAADVVDIAGRAGFDSWMMIGSTQLVAVATLRALSVPDGERDTVALAARGAELGGLADLWQAMELLVLLPYYMTVAGAALAAAGDVDGATARYAQAHTLAGQTGMCFYEAETARREAFLATDSTRVRRGLRSALHLARGQCARPFELRIALDLHSLEGDGAGPLVETALRGIADDASSVDIDAARAVIASAR